jgi:plastocyanin
VKRVRLIRLSAWCIAVMAVLALAGCGGASSSGGGATPAGGTTVVEKNLTFIPGAVTVKSGAVVTFSNQDSVPHRVKIDNRVLGQQAPGSDVKWTAPKDGTYPFSCVIHPSMTGQIVVGSGGGGGSGY